MDGEWEPPMVTNPEYKVHKFPFNEEDLIYNPYANFLRELYGVKYKAYGFILLYITIIVDMSCVVSRTLVDAPL